MTLKEHLLLAQHELGQMADQAIKEIRRDSKNLLLDLTAYQMAWDLMNEKPTK